MVNLRGCLVHVLFLKLLNDGTVNVVTVRNALKFSEIT